MIGVRVSLSISATDSSSATLSYAATGLPSGLSINGSTGVISGTFGSTGNSTVTVTATDGTDTTTQTFNWSVGRLSLADPGSHYTRRVVDTAVRLVVEDGLPYRCAGWALWRDHRVFVPYATIQNWVEAGGEKGGPTDRPGLSRRGPVRLRGLHRRRRAV